MATEERLSITVTVSGPEVAKWLANRMSVLRTQQGPVAPGLYCTYSDAPVWVEMQDALGLPTLGDATASFTLGREDVFQYTPDLDSPALIAAAAVISVDEKLDGLLSQAKNLEVRVERG